MLKEPPKKIIRIGYNLTQARLKYRENGSYYLEQALMWMTEMRPKIVKQARADGITANEHDFSEAFEILWKAQHGLIQYRADPSSRDYALVNAAAESIGRAHKLLADIMERYGYRPITLDDFAEFGAGGGR